MKDFWHGGGSADAKGTSVAKAGTLH